MRLEDIKVDLSVVFDDRLDNPLSRRIPHEYVGGSEYGWHQVSMRLHDDMSTLLALAGALSDVWDKFHGTYHTVDVSCTVRNVNELQMTYRLLADSELMSRDGTRIDVSSMTIPSTTRFMCDLLDQAMFEYVYDGSMFDVYAHYGERIVGTLLSAKMNRFSSEYVPSDFDVAMMSPITSRILGKDDECGEPDGSFGECPHAHRTGSAYVPYDGECGGIDKIRSMSDDGVCDDADASGASGGRVAKPSSGTVPARVVRDAPSCDGAVDADTKDASVRNAPRIRGYMSDRLVGVIKENVIAMADLVSVVSSVMRMHPAYVLPSALRVMCDNVDGVVDAAMVRDAVVRDMGIEAMKQDDGVIGRSTDTSFAIMMLRFVCAYCEKVTIDGASGNEYKPTLDDVADALASPFVSSAVIVLAPSVLSASVTGAMLYASETDMGQIGDLITRYIAGNIVGKL